MRPTFYAPGSDVRGFFLGGGGAQHGRIPRGKPCYVRVMANEVKPNCTRATECEEVGGIVDREPMNKHLAL